MTTSWARDPSYARGIHVATNPTEVEDDVVILSREDILDYIDHEARAALNISGEHFLELWRSGALPDSWAARNIAILASLLSDSNARSGAP